MKDLTSFGEARIKIIALPKDTNSSGNIFGGWIMSQIDMAGVIAARELAPERVVTISMDEIIFKEPVYVGDLISCYAKVIKVGTTSIRTQIEVTALRQNNDGFTECVQVTSAFATFVSVTKDGVKKPIDPELKRLHGF
ncbi:acyl-CoA thioesterase [Campylobacter pinnipediorum]|uniref:Acyl-CoA thioesterase n=1 Tax=Campylobacter pinnipediorum subsp. pinnipediorum TaxID=1660067 RepID=A0AAX0L9Q8_9BACT|nr:acyl-CoA thioesterase [Campylobacter pinnipediorum]AQW81815.1 acyl-CoA thioesterase [Campylobacter pinnipediorum subsp. pinnipediorum]AQW83491.1 acyl-CoA thioesterase [Campylobacter pinnipediorum subsp. pinnipediorum]AQW85011.1 acyl-CoA thioesterase [Campylobacter pinnipediorum subsp. pinnipediorum]OPA76401.1 acyl-CoA thioesterase [Campylobacter pinnipediorum subsp. pinnipediorum]OPA79862.1 acyl-CoA thioesterase [Campylobacter pinnipediorum subsp. pinnipediorum]